RENVDTEAIGLLRRVRRHTSLPLAPGFGISTPQHVQTFAEAGADAVIVGSAIVRIVEQYRNEPEVMEEELRSYVRQMKRTG
ncbi:MAG TPA: tryptophan synthase subunit alpha, partial [Methanoregulaceae archaeon]|nr:tryptophan synthase subunit alpha [Methanoregulaceae archaeon]